MEQLTLIIVSAIINAVSACIGIYIGFTKGSEKTVDIALNKIEKRSKNSPTMQRFTVLMEMTDKLFGDDQAVEQITRFFKEATDLVSSPEAKNFFANITKVVKELSGSKEEKEIIKLPKKMEPTHAMTP